MIQGGIMQISRRPDLTDQVAIVTGAVRGIGQASAVALAREGANVVVADVLHSLSSEQNR
jgi:3-oxoacyl-[acyl-carrier protein] reductase